MDGMRTKIVLICLAVALVAIGMIGLGGSVPYQKTFQFSAFGTYKAVDIQGKTYFMGYGIGYLYENSNSKTLSGDLVSEVLRDRYAEWKISTYVPLVLAEGYQLRIKSLDVDGNKLYLELARDGQVVDSSVVQPSKSYPQMQDQTYLYKTTLDNAKGIIQIAVHFKDAYRSNGISIATIDGVWQISANVQTSTLGSPCNAIKCHFVGGTCCKAGCVKLQTNSNNCGACGNVCTGWRKCGGGKCVCISGSTLCNGQKCLGGSGSELGYSIRQTTDGGCITVGETEGSNDGDVSGWHAIWDQYGLPISDFWVVKLDKFGALQWQRCLGGSDYECARSVQQTTDGGYIVAGYTRSVDGDVSGNHGNSEAWVVKLKQDGGVEWTKCIGGSADDFAYGIRQTTDGGYVVVGYTGSTDGDACFGGVCGSHGHLDGWVVKLKPNGDIDWQKCLGGAKQDEAYDIQQTKDGGFVVAGLTKSNEGDVSGWHAGYDEYTFPLSDIWVVKLDKFGTIQWQKCLGGSKDDMASGIQQASDGGYVIAGRTWSKDGDVSGWHVGKDVFGDASDMWVVKLDEKGNSPVWQKCLGGSGSEGYWRDEPTGVQQTLDGGYVVAGYTESNDGDVSGNHGNRDAWIVKLSSGGALEGQKCLGGNGRDMASSIQQTTDAGYVVSGFTDSNDGDVSGNHAEDAWVVKMPPTKWL